MLRILFTQCAVCMKTAFGRSSYLFLCLRYSIRPFIHPMPTYVLSLTYFFWSLSVPLSPTNRRTWQTTPSSPLFCAMVAASFCSLANAKCIRGMVHKDQGDGEKKESERARRGNRETPRGERQREGRKGIVHVGFFSSICFLRRNGLVCCLLFIVYCFVGVGVVVFPLQQQPKKK